MALNLEQQEIRRNWLDLPSDVTANILNRIGLVDILFNAQLVCTTWHKICKYPTMWRVINMNDLLSSGSKLSAAHMCKHAVDRSQGQLVDITLVRKFNYRFFLYIADRASQLRRLEMVCAKYTGSLTTHAFMKFPLLEELNLYYITISKEEIETLGRYCPMLKTLKLNYEIVPRNWATGISTTTDEGCLNARAIAIGQNLPELRHLELIGNSLTNSGLKVILDNCRRLETLDLRACRNINLKGDLGERCTKQIKNLKLPHDDLEIYPYYFEVFNQFFDADIYEDELDLEDDDFDFNCLMNLYIE